MIVTRTVSLRIEQFKNWLRLKNPQTNSLRYYGSITREQMGV